jgi:hypothetical protein
VFNTKRDDSRFQGLSHAPIEAAHHINIVRSVTEILKEHGFPIVKYKKGQENGAGI